MTTRRPQLRGFLGPTASMSSPPGKLFMPCEMGAAGVTTNSSNLFTPVAIAPTPNAASVTQVIASRCFPLDASPPLTNVPTSTGSDRTHLT